MKEVIIIVGVYMGEEQIILPNYNLIINGIPKGYLSKEDVLKLIDQEIGVKNT